MKSEITNLWNNVSDCPRELIQGCRSGDQKAQLQVYKLFYKPVFRNCLQIVSDAVEAESLMHGRSDSIALPSSCIEFAATLDGKCRLVLWDDAFHELHNETFKSEVFETMTSWIGELLTER